MNEAEQQAAADRELWAAYFDTLAAQAVQRVAMRRFGRPVPCRHDTIIKREIEKLLATIKPIDIDHENDAPGIVAPVTSVVRVDGLGSGEKVGGPLNIDGGQQPKIAAGKTVHLDHAVISGDGRGISRVGFEDGQS